MDWQARVIEDYQSLARNTVRLVIWRNQGERTEFLMPDGTHQLVDAFVDPGDVGVVVPRGALVPLAAEMVKHLGDALPSAGEVRVLRQWLDVERARTDHALKRDA